jgi:DNA-binding HxlR family transcriptional regulator
MARRSYDQFCATARTLDLIGDRWTLLLIRELLSGPKRFGDLHRSLPGLGTALLTERLRHLQDEGLLKAVTLPAPARSAAYELTEAGAELRAVVMALARWGLRWAIGEKGDGDAFEPGWAVLALEAIFDPAGAHGMRWVCEFRIGAEVLHARIEDGAIDACYGPAEQPDVVLTGSETAFAEIVAGHATLAQAIKAGTVEVTGDREALADMAQVFRWPDRADRHQARPA